MTRTNPAGRLHRWSLTLQEYEFDIEYRPGSTNVVADALSRAPAAVLAAIGQRRGPDVEVPGSAAEAAQKTATPEVMVAAVTEPVPAPARPLTRATKQRAEEAAKQAADAVATSTAEPAVQAPSAAVEDQRLVTAAQRG
jgi:hypothetical protein